MGGILEALIFKKYNMKIKLCNITALIGPESSGKSTVFKLLSNKIKNDTVYLDKKRLNDYKIDFLKRNIMCVFDIENFNTLYVKDELAYYLKKFKISNNDISLKISSLTHYFYLEDIIDVKIDSLSIEEKSLIKILSFLIVNPLVLGIDNLFGYINIDNVVKIINYAKEHNIALIYATPDVEKNKYADEIHIIDNFKSVRSGNIYEIYNDKITRNLGLEKPFLIELNEYLKDYELIDENFDTINEGVNALWK